MLVWILVGAFGAFALIVGVALLMFLSADEINDNDY